MDSENSSDNLYRLAGEQHKKGQVEEAQNTLKQLLQQDSSYASAWLALAKITKAPELKRKYLGFVLDLEPGHQAAEQMLAALNQQNGSNEEKKSAPDPANYIKEASRHSKPSSTGQYICPFCKSSFVYQRMQTKASPRTAVNAAFLLFFVSCLLMFATRVMIASGNIDGPDPFGDRNFGMFAIALLLGLAAGAVAFIASRKNKLYYECKSCNRTW